MNVLQCNDKYIQVGEEEEKWFQNDNGLHLSRLSSWLLMPCSKKKKGTRSPWMNESRARAKKISEEAGESIL